MGGDECDSWPLASLVVVGSLGGVGPVVGCWSSTVVGSSFGATHRWAVVSAIVVVAVFFLVATCRLKDTSWVSLFEAGKMRDNGP
jgi:hypothetical protein